MEKSKERMERFLREIEADKKADWSKFELTGKMRKAGKQVLGEIIFSVDGKETIIHAELISDTQKPISETAREFFEKITETPTKN